MKQKKESDYLDLLIIIIWSQIALISIYILPDGHIVRLIFGLPLLILFPGYALVSVLWPEKRRNKLTDLDDNLERVAMSLGLSIVSISFVGLILAISPIGVTLDSTILSILIMIFVLSVYAYYRRVQLSKKKRFTMVIDFKSKMPENPTERIIVIALSCLLILSATVLTYVVITPIEGENYTNFYILDSNMRADNYPVNTTVNVTESVFLVIDSHELKTVNYTVSIGNENASMEQNVSEWDVISKLSGDLKISMNQTLDDGERFIERFNFTFTEPGLFKLIFELKPEGSELTYETHLWVNVDDN